MRLLKAIKRKLKDESGQALAMALIMLVLGGLLVVPTLSFMTTNLNANRQIDTANLELYAADAGVENMLWNIQYDLYDADNNPLGFKLPKVVDPPKLLPEFTLNDRTVDTQISKESGSLYKIISTGTSANGHYTTVQCFVNVQAGYAWFFDSAINSVSNVSISPNSVVNGDVTYSGDNPDIKGTVTDIDNDGETVTQDTGLSDKWPTADELIEVYSAQVANLTPFTDGSIDVSGYTAAAPRSIWNGAPGDPPDPLLAQGNLEIKGGGYARLDGTLYIEKVSSDDGNLTVKPGCTIDLNGQTIFAEGWIDLQPGCVIIGSGCVIAVGDIKFSPNIGAAVSDKLIGVADIAGTASQNGSNFILARFQAEKTGKLEIFRMYCSGSDGYVKVALYADSGGETPTPTSLISAANQSQQQLVTKSTWNNISFWRNEAKDVTQNTYYWLAADASANNIITYKAETGPTSVMRTETFDVFSFPDPAGIGFTRATDKQYLFAGYQAPFVFILSVAGSSTIKPNGTLYGSVAGGNTQIDTAVEMQGKTVLTLSNTPSTGLNFPGWDQDSDNSTGIPPRIRTYTIK